MNSVKLVAREFYTKKNLNFFFKLHKYINLLNIIWNEKENKLSNNLSEGEIAWGEVRMRMMTCYISIFYSYGCCLQFYTNVPAVCCLVSVGIWWVWLLSICPFVWCSLMCMWLCVCVCGGELILQVKKWQRSFLVRRRKNARI